MNFKTTHRAFGDANIFAGKAVARFANTIGLTVMVCLLSGIVHGQTLQDLGAAAPIPGLIDIIQLSTSGNQTTPDGLNYYTDNQSVHDAGEPGQTFTTGTNSAGYILSSVSFMTAGLRSQAPHRGASRRDRTPRCGVRRDPAELQYFQRRRLAAMERLVRDIGGEFNLCLVVRPR